MSETHDARQWLGRREPSPPPRLLERMREALNACEPLPRDLSAQLGEAAVFCLRSALERPEQRASALDLLAADALLTYGCEAATLESPDAVERFAESYGAARLGSVLLPNAQVQRLHPGASPRRSAK
ncbi:MAG: hypothetical protein ACREMQ_15345 [Longimicrobiales bacterium]